MAKKSHNRRHNSHRRARRGGALAPLQSGAYPDVDNGSSKWNTSVTGGAAAAASGYKSFLSQFNGTNPMQNSMALNKYALEGVGQSGGGSRRKRHGHGTRRRSGGAHVPGHVAPAHGSHVAPAHGSHAAPAHGSHAAAHKGQSGGMFASFGALLKEALVPLGLLAAQQTYGKRHSRKHRSSGSHTRKHRH